MTDSGYEELANAIILQAVKDYRSALNNNKHMVREINRFFRSEWFRVLTNIDGEMLICKLQK